MERAKGFEPSAIIPLQTVNQSDKNSHSQGYTQIRAQDFCPRAADLEKVVAAWPSLAGALKAAILAIVNSGILDKEGPP
jgi:hypothetical protein